MDESVITYLNKRLPDELLVNHIYPHLYQVQPKKLLVDIRSYVSDLELLSEVYNTEFNEVILFNDMVNFVTRRSLSIQMMNTQYTLFGEDFYFNVETSTMQVNNISKYQFNQDSYLRESTWLSLIHI